MRQGAALEGMAAARAVVMYAYCSCCGLSSIPMT